MVNENIELLAPVGSMESLYAAVQNGANAVYLGGKMFSARQYANNFDDDELKQAVEYAHLRGVKIYVTVNILIDDGEMKDTLDYIKYLYEIDIDGLIVQDLGLAYLVRRVFPDFELHGSTQMTVNNLPGAIFLNKVGFDRVVLARETPIDEIKYIHANSDIELEGFIHGALCVCYSGQCLMSSMLGGRSGNRGKCAQPCRMAYSFVDYSKGTIVFDRWKEKHLLSPRDLNTLDYIDDIIDSGIISLKIEGRMKRAEYVATIVKNYRNALDIGRDSITEKDKKNITQIFNRGFTKGYMLGDFGREAISYERPDNRGVFIGEVVQVVGKDVYIKLMDKIKKGDGIELETSKGNYVGKLVDFNGETGKVIIIENMPHIPVGSKVYKTSSAELLRLARESYEGDKIKYPIRMEVNISIDELASLTLIYKDKRIKVQSNNPVEIAKKVALTEQKVIDQLSKLNDTVYYLDDIQIELDENAFMAVRDINKLRRDAIEILDNMRKDFNKRIPISNMDYGRTIDKYFILENRSFQIKNRISVSVRNKEQFEQLNLNKLDRLYIGFDDSLEETISKVKSEGKEVYLLTDRILYRKDLEVLEDKISPIVNIIDGISVANIGTLQFVKDNFDIEIHGETGLNPFNSYTVELLKDFGVKGITLSPELNMNQIKKIVKMDSIIYETIGYGYLPLMITKHCPMALVKNCQDDGNCNTCPYSQGYGIRDRKNIDFYMERRKGTTTIYNSVPLMILDNIHQVYDNDIDMIRLDFTFEEENIREIQEIYYDYANKTISKDVVDKYINDYRNKNHITRGHYYRGVI